MFDRLTVSLLFLFLSGPMLGCGGGEGEKSPQVALGSAVCDACGMTLKDSRFIAVIAEPKPERAYDSIECLVRVMRASGETVSDAIWIADFDARTLRRQSELTLVHADFPSPMGGGYAAFAGRDHARAEAEARNGEFGTFEQAVGGTLERSAP